MSNINSTFSSCVEIKAAEKFEKNYELLSARYPAGKRCSSFPHIVASPIHYEKGFAYPLLVWLHDADKTELDIFDVIPKISARNYVAVAPRGLMRQKKRVVRSLVHGKLTEEKRWSEPCYDWLDSEESVSEAENLVFDSIAEAQGKYNVNMRRIFLLGQGAGGSMALRIAMRNPHEFAGVVSIDSALPQSESTPFRNWRALRDLPILVTSGDSKAVTVPKLNKDQLRLYHAAGLTVLVRQYNEERAQNGRQDRLNSILADVNRWIMERATNPQAPSVEMLLQYEQQRHFVE
ncbi:MAG: hypothetical protein PHO46_09775 [Thermoguttaceae bacterium]|jgi:phospholipase/carboxylesterase|nr:hypothetical protein [Thermoguttaceae bacterium]